LRVAAEPARPPPPAFPFLRFNLSKSDPAGPLPQPSRLVSETTRSSPACPAENHEAGRESSARLGRRSSVCPATRVQLIAWRGACQHPCRKKFAGLVCRDLAIDSYIEIAAIRGIEKGCCKERADRVQQCGNAATSPAMRKLSPAWTRCYGQKSGGRIDAN
jgi:hypothetical protein